MVLIYARNKHVGAEYLAKGQVRVRAAVEDTLFSGWVEIDFALDTLAVLAARGEVRRGIVSACLGGPELLSRIVGLRVAQGMTRTVDGLVGGANGCTTMANLVMECCHAVVSIRRRDERRRLAGAGVTREDHLRSLLRPGSRLRNSCVAFAEASPLLERLGLAAGERQIVAAEDGGADLQQE